MSKRRTLCLSMLTLLLLALYPNNMEGQDIKKHQWQNRLLMVLSEEPADKTFVEQLSVLNTCWDGLSERKLLIYQILPDRYRVSAASESVSDWRSSGSLYQQFGAAQGPFEIILIGLDGGIKLRKRSLLSCEELWAVIDKMPMRQSEIRNRK